MQLERRFVPADDVEIRVAGDGGPEKIEGYFALYERWSPVYGKFREKIAPGFFDEAVGRDDVRALFNHDSSRLLGRSNAGTLKLRADQVGLHGEISPIPNTPTGQEVKENLGLRNLTGASFAFTLPPEGGEEWRKGDDGVWERTLRQIGQLFDVSVVTDPFYPQTEVGMRMVCSQLEDSFNRWAEAHPEAVAEPPTEPTIDAELYKARMRLAEL
jgi:HK97 family phage prohead protease